MTDIDETQRELRPGETVLDRMRFLRALQLSPWLHSGFTRGQGGGGITVGAFFPTVAHHTAGSAAEKAQADAWEASAEIMHDAQQVITLPDKPAHSGTRGKYSAVAAFEAQYADEPIPNFADTPGATGNHRTLSRSS